jgi:hypothetical protein
MFKLKYICLWLIKLFVSFCVQHDKRSFFLEIYEARLVTHKIWTYIRRYWTNSMVLDSVYCKLQYQITLKMYKYFQFQHAPKQTVYPNLACTQTVHPVLTRTQTDSLSQFNMHPDSLLRFNMHPNRQFSPIQHAPKQTVHPNYMLIFLHDIFWAMLEGIMFAFFQKEHVPDSWLNFLRHPFKYTANLKTMDEEMRPGRNTSWIALRCRHNLT